MKDSFLKILQTEGQKPYFQNILNGLQETEKNGKNIYPHQMDMFRPFEFFQLPETKVVILGQDPYHSLNVADGLAFSTKQAKTPASLRNMFKELQKDYPKTKIETNDLSAWAKQGVLLLNTVWTVTENEPNSHKSFGWQQFTHVVLENVLKENPNAIFVILGREAEKFTKDLNINPKNKIVLSHPSPYSYKKGFENGEMFKKINNRLKATHQGVIKWDLLKEVK
ncbi:uracil-DNA glycosylase [Mycoplasma hafezii]|uniref:uracil-DNA glycosylase n=1 Tax=Mycoplasma hafezii TaxID=525886 RepID=UPI003CF2266F